MIHTKAEKIQEVDIEITDVVMSIHILTIHWNQYTYMYIVYKSLI